MSWHLTKVKAGSLQFAILLSVVIAIVISAFILLSYTQQRFAKQIDFANDAIKLSNTAFDYLKQKKISYNDSIKIYPESLGDKSFTLFKNHWGIYDKVVGIGVNHNFKHQKIALTGGQIKSEDRVAIKLDETNSPLVVVGKTNIKGNVVLPQAGVKAGTIAGVYFQGDYLIDGLITQVTTVRPTISNDKLNYLKGVIYGAPPSEDSLYIRSVGKVVSSSFLEKPKWLYNKGVITINDQVIEDNIIIKSDTLIRVSAFAKAKNIILIAPHIEIENNVKGTFQALASKRILVGENVKLDYPSALVLITKEDKIVDSREDTNEISLGSQSVISGTILQIGGSNNKYQNTIIKLSEKSLVRGEVYSDQSVELLGEVQGSVYVHRFEANVKGSVYRNHLYNSVINSKSFPESFCGILTNKTETNVAQWVY